MRVSWTWCVSRGTPPGKRDLTPRRVPCRPQIYTKHDLAYPHDNGFLFPDVQWHSYRLMELIQYIRGMFGDDIPLMYRSRQLRLSDYRRGMLKIFQLDQGNKDTARRMGVRCVCWAGGPPMSQRSRS